ncbi:MAG: chlorophyll a/b binding light-harvesting protein [Cyanobacteria bacterium P01_A01_bin.17]
MTSANANGDYGAFAGNGRLIDMSGKWLSAHIAQYSLICLWASLITFLEVAVYNPDLPMGEQGLILIPHLAAFGMGVEPGGVIDTSTYTLSAFGHLFGAAVYAFGAFFHSRVAPGELGEIEGRGSKWEFEWDDPEKLGFILGHHLLLLGVTALLFVGWIRFHGIYDPAIGDIRTVSNPGATIRSVIFEYGLFTPGHNPYFVDNLEDIASGHAFIGVVEICGGIWHITQKPYEWATRLLSSLYSADGQLASSLAGLSVLGFAAAYFSAVNTVAYPVEFFGPPLDLEFTLFPRFVDTVDLPSGAFSARAWLSNVHFLLAFFILQGHLYHALKACGFEFERIPSALGSIAE